MLERPSKPYCVMRQSSESELCRNPKLDCVFGPNFVPFSMGHQPVPRSRSHTPFVYSFLLVWRPIAPEIPAGYVWSVSACSMVFHLSQENNCSLRSKSKSRSKVDRLIKAKLIQDPIQPKPSRVARRASLRSLLASFSLSHPSGRSPFCHPASSRGLFLLLRDVEMELAVASTGGCRGGADDSGRGVNPASISSSSKSGPSGN